MQGWETLTMDPRKAGQEFRNKQASKCIKQAASSTNWINPRNVAGSLVGVIFFFVRIDRTGGAVPSSASLWGLSPALPPSLCPRKIPMSAGKILAFLCYTGHCV